MTKSAIVSEGRVMLFAVSLESGGKFQTITRSTRQGRKLFRDIEKFVQNSPWYVLVSITEPRRGRRPGTYTEQWIPIHECPKRVWAKGGKTYRMLPNMLPYREAKE